MKMTAIWAPMIALGLIVSATAQAGPGGNPANKVAVVGSANTLIGGNIGIGDTPGDPLPGAGPVTLLTEYFKASDKADYVAQVTMECAIGSYDIDYGLYGGFGLDARFAAVRVWIEIDEEPLYGGRGSVNFCDRGVAQLYFDGIGDDFEIQLERVSGAYAFNWPILDLEHGDHMIEVKARLISFILSEDDILDEGIFARIGKRTLILEPIHVKVDETIGTD